MAPHPTSLTVVMPVHNAMPWLDAAIASIAGQSFTAFRLAIYDDHSTDGSYEAALAWAARDARIAVTRGAARLGPCGSSNAAAALAETEFVARMDADDLAHPERLAVQLAALAEHPEAVLTGSVFDVIDGTGTVLFTTRGGSPGSKSALIGHPSILYRRAVFDAVGGYRAGTDYFEDHDLFLRMCAHGPILVIDRPLVQVRFAGQNHRLSEDPGPILEHINRNYAAPAGPKNPTRPLSPIAFYSLANLAMLGGRRPHIFGLMLRRAQLDLHPATLAAFAFVGLAEASPRLARRVWQGVSALRNRLAPQPARSESSYLWWPQGNSGAS